MDWLSNNPTLVDVILHVEFFLFIVFMLLSILFRTIASKALEMMVESWKKLPSFKDRDISTGAGAEDFDALICDITSWGKKRFKNIVIAKMFWRIGWVFGVSVFVTFILVNLGQLV